MDSQVANDYFEKNKGKTLRLDPYIIQKMGLIKNQVILKVEEFYLNCVPFELSPRSCRCISILDPREVEFFQQFLEGTHKISFVFQNPLFTKQLTIPVLVKLTEFAQYNKESRYCLIGMEFLRLSHEFKEIVATTMMGLDRLEKVYNDDNFSKKAFSGAQIKTLLQDDHVQLSLAGQRHRLSKIISLGVKSCRLFCECMGQVEGNPQEQLWEMTLPALEKKTAAACKAHLLGHEVLKEVPDYFFMDFQLEYSPGWIETLIPLFQQKEG